MDTTVSVYNTKCSGCQKPLYHGVQRQPFKVNRPAGYSLGFLCEECVDMIISK